MSSTNKTANYQLSQFVGTDIPSILNDYNGDMRKIDTAIKEVANAGGDNATAVAELQATVGQHTTEIGGINSTVNALSGRVLGVESKIPANASESNKLITAEDIPEIPSIEGLEQDVGALQTAVDTIETVIPATASESNKLATVSDIPSVAGGWELAYSNEDYKQVVNDSAFADFCNNVLPDIIAGTKLLKVVFRQYEDLLISYLTKNPNLVQFQLSGASYVLGTTFTATMLNILYYPTGANTSSVTYTEYTNEAGTSSFRERTDIGGGIRFYVMDVE